MDLPHNILLYVLLLVAVGAGYLIGKRERKRPRPQQAVIKDYYQGLNFLLGDKPELGVDRFIDAMEVSDQTIDVHLAMASVVRRRGEVDKAIRIHQNLLASPVLNRTNKQLVEMELSRDYHTAGLLDRAEKLLQEIVGRKGTQEAAALELLLDLYEQEREWQKAIEVSAKLTKTNAEMRMRVGHFYCELAQQALEANELRQALTLTRQARNFAPNQARGHWMAAQVEYAQRRPKKVLRLIQKAVELSPELVAEYVELYRQACESMGQDEEYERFLQHSLSLYPDARLVSELLEYRRKNGYDLAIADLVEEIGRAPSFAHLPLLLQLGVEQPQAQDLQQQIAHIVEAQSGYQCGNCGFTSHGVLWHCPGCRAWGSFGAAGRFKAALNS